MHTRSSKSLLSGIALVTGLVAGCVFTTGDGDLDGDTDGDGDCPGANIHESFDECFCDVGYEWEDPSDDSNLNCVPEMEKNGDCDEPGNVEIDGTCYCDENLSWCSDDPNDFSCCEDPGHNDAGTGADDVADSGDTGVDTGVDTGTDTAPDDTGPDPDTGVEPDPLDCTEDGLNFCSNTEAQGPEGSRVWVCMGGEWVENSTIGDESCMFDGFDFAYGCVSMGDTVQFVCGDGPGTACEGDSASCVDTDVINYCLYGKLSEDSCFRICTEDGDDMDMTYEHGQCDAEAMECFCCDEGDEGCNIG